MAASWYVSGGGRGQRDMVVLPYRDRLEVFSRYLQQLVMESLGKRVDRNDEVVHQGIAVYGNKGLISTPMCSNCVMVSTTSSPPSSRCSRM